MATAHATSRRKLVPDDFEDASDETSRCSVSIPAGARTWEGFVAWATSQTFPQRVRAAFIDGEILIDMSPEELETHAIVKAEIYRVLMQCNRERKLGKFYPDGCLLTNKAAALSTEPDGTFVTRASFRRRRVRMVPRKNNPAQFIELRGIPDWVLEIVSEYSVMKDKKKLWKQYHRAGIPEYWLIDARGDEIIFQILHWRRSRYVAAPSKEGWQRSRVFGVGFRLDREKDDLGLWEYTLHVEGR